MQIQQSLIGAQLSSLVKWSVLNCYSNNYQGYLQRHPDCLHALNVDTLFSNFLDKVIYFVMCDPWKEEAWKSHYGFSDHVLPKYHFQAFYFSSVFLQKLKLLNIWLIKMLFTTVLRRNCVFQAHCHSDSYFIFDLF